MPKHLYATCIKVLTNKFAKLRMRLLPDADTRSCLLMFHDILPDGTPPADEYACPFSMFCRILEAYRARGFTFVSLDTLLDAPRQTAKRKLCVVTFDDGFASISSLVAPYLAKEGIPFTAYVTTGYLGTSNYLTHASLATLAANPMCTVGSHTVTHPMTRFLSVQQVKSELTESRKILAQLTGRTIEHFAFPYGSAYACSRRDMRLAKVCGYKSAALTTQTCYFGGMPFARYCLPRLDMPQQYK